MEKTPHALSMSLAFEFFSIPLVVKLRGALNLSPYLDSYLLSGVISSFHKPLSMSDA